MQNIARSMGQFLRLRCRVGVVVQITLACAARLTRLNADDYGMLLFDRVQQTAWTPPASLLRDEQGHGLLVLRKMAELIRGSHVYVLDNLARYLHERFAAWQEEEPEWREVAPAAQAPFERTWFEWSLAGVEQEPFRGWHRVGVLMRRQGADGLRSQEGIPSGAEYFWQPRIAVWRAEASLPIWPPTTHRAFADREGTVFGAGRIVGPNTFGDYFTYCSLAIALMAVAWTNARNVDQKVHNAAGPGTQSSESRQTPYRTLHVRPTDASRAAGVDGEAYLRWHVVRGRWKTFTPERPLLGRPGLHGRYWVEPEPRGRQKDSGRRRAS
jgi:hypothetical protein